LQCIEDAKTSETEGSDSDGSVYHDGDTSEGNSQQGDACSMESALSSKTAKLGVLEVRSVWPQLHCPSSTVEFQDPHDKTWDVNVSMGYSGQAKNSSRTVIPIFLTLLSGTHLPQWDLG
jgi:hypothetical protein